MNNTETKVYTAPFKPMALWLTDTQELNTDPSARSHWVTAIQGALPYIPLLDLINLGDSVKLAHAESPDKNIYTYNPNASTQRLNPVVVQNNRLKLSGFDLIQGDITLILNFSSMALTVHTDTNVQHFAALSCDKAKEYKDRVFYVKITALSSPVTVEKSTGMSNYFERMIDLHCRVQTKRSEEYKEMLQFAKECWSQNFCHANNVASNTIKVASLFEIKSSSLQHIRDGGCIHYSNLGARVMMTQTAESTPNHHFQEDLTHSSEVVKSFRDNAMSCFIVDNTSSIDDRFYNFMGQATRIPKIKDTSLVEGLYMVSADKQGSLTPNDITALKDIDKLSFIYSTLEAATTGSDLSGLNKQQHEETVARLTRENTLATLALTKERGELEMRVTQERELSAQRMRDMENTHKAALLEHEARHKKEINDLQLSLRRRESEYDHSKFNYDTNVLKAKGSYEADKFFRDSTIESIKTAGSLAALAIAGMMAYKRLA